MHYGSRLGFITLFVIGSHALTPRSAAAGAFELSLGVSYNRSNYLAGGYTSERRWGSSVGYHFTERTEIEFAFQDVSTLNNLTGLENTRFHDQIYSLNWVQALTGKNFPVQPYAKVGVGQLNREATGTYASGAAPPAIVDSVTGVLGVGMRIYLTKTFGIRSEVTSYLAGGSIRTWKDNLSYNVGVSLYF